MNRFIKLFTIFIIILSSNINASERANEILLKRIEKYRLKDTKIKEHISIDRQNNIVYYKTMYDDYLLSIDSVNSFENYIYYGKKKYLSEQFNNMLFKEIARTSSASGLIGDIEVPVTFGKLGSFLGEGSKLIVDGSERVEFTGANTIDLNPVLDDSEGNSWYPELVPFQHLIVSVTGTIGDRIKVNLKHNSQTEQESDNKVKIEYTGDEDDILQTIEAGDIALSLPGVKLIGAPPQHEGLFGVKTTGQLGPLNFTAIASKETGESSSQTFTGNTTSDTIKRYDIEFAKNRFYLTGLNFNDSIIEFNLYRDDGNGYNNETQGAVPGNLLVMPGSNDSIIYEGYFIQLIEGENNDYIMGSTNQYIELLKDAGVAEGLGVSYIVKRNTGQIDTVGSFSYEIGDTLIMKGLKIKEDFNGSPTWNYMMRNVYSFSSTNIIPESFLLTIKKVDNASGEDSEIENGKTYLQIMNIDNNNDGIVDYNYINFNRGYIMFPDLEPFSSTELAEPDDEIYLTNETGYNIGRLYYLEIVYRGAQSVYSLGTFNILEGSEVVTVNGRQLAKGSDYTIDYEYGIVTFLTDEANSPDADIKIDYQYTPFLSVMSKNLVGLHLDYKPSDNITMNSNWLYHTLSYQLDDYPRLGEEPSEALVGEFDIGYKEELGVLSRIFNILPFYQSNDNSLFSLTGKAGMSYPNPNSTGKAYVEDMESVLNETSLASDRKLWYFGSLLTGYNANDLSQDYYWYNDRETMGNINDQLPVQDKTSEVSILEIIMTPDTFNTTSTYVVLNQTISKTGIDLSDMRFLQVWVKGDNGQLIVEIAKNIPEDMLRRDKNGDLMGIGTMETEDINYDGILDNSEDNGLDGVTGDDTQSIPGDDGNDDYYYSSEHPNDYSKINRTENNNVLDTEDKNGDLRLNTESDLYRFTYDLSSDENLIYSHPTSGWKLLRIPLNDPSVLIEGNPDLKYIKTARIMWNGITQKDTLQLYQISMISNKWNNFFTIGSGDDKFYVGAKNNQTDLDYSPPFNPGYDLSGREKKEQSIVLFCDSIDAGEGGKVFRYLSRKENFERYKTLSFYMKSTENDSLTVYIRFGGDSQNVYSISYIPTTNWAYVELPIESLVNLKRDSMALGSYQNGLYGFKGLPSLTNVGYIEFTVMNNTLNNTVSEIWIDDIMLLEPKREIGIAGDISGNLNVPGIFTMSGTFAYRDPFFHRLNDKKGSGSYSKNYSFNSVLNSEKLLPEMFGLNIPINYSYNSGISEPFYKIGSDYKLSDDEIANNLSLNKTHSVSSGISRSKKSTNPFIRYTFDNLRINGNMSNTTRSTYNKVDTTGNYGSNISYGLNPNMKPKRLFNKMNIWLLPSNMSYKVGYSSRWATSYTKSDTAYINTGNSKSENISRNLGINYKMFPSLSMNLSENRLNDPGLLGAGYTDFLGKDIGKNSVISITYNPKIIKLFTHNLSFSANYSDQMNARVITVIDSSKITSVNNSGRISLNGYVDYPYFLRWISLFRNESKDAEFIAGSPQWLLMKLGVIADMFTPLNYSYSRNRSSSFSYMLTRAPILYQIALVDTINTSWLSDYSQKSKTYSENYSLSSGVNLYNLSVNSSYSYAYSRTGYLATQNENINLRWPTISVALNGIQEYFSIDKFFRSINLRSSYTVSESKSGKVGEDYDRITFSENMTPIIGISFMTKNNLNIDYNYSITKSGTFTYGTIETERSNENKSHNASLSYAFNSPTGFNIPVINKRIRFRSNVNLKLDFTYSQILEYDKTNDNVLQNVVRYTITPRADYNFSNNITGGINGSFSRSDDRKRGDKRANLSLSIWVLFRF